MSSQESHVQYLEAQLGLARREISNLRQQFKTLSYTHHKEMDEITKKLEDWRCLGCRSMPHVPIPESQSPTIVQEIGTIRTDFPEKRGTPRQPGICGDTIAKVTLNEVFTNPGHALEGLEDYSHMWILFHFHLNESNHLRAKVAPPRLNGTRTGVFATRSPHRPSPIGLSLVKIERVDGNTVYFSGVDMVDGTPVLDLKPYIPQYDHPDLVATREVEDGGPSGASGDSTRIMDGKESTNPTPSSLSRSTLDQLIYDSSRIGEREDPEGEEESERPPPIPSTDPPTSVRIPSWVNRPPVATLSVSFRDRALAQLAQLGPEGDEKKRIIENVLREDPRSVYLRESWSGHCYVFRISELHVSCRFNDEDHSVVVYQVSSNSGPEEEDI